MAYFRMSRGHITGFQVRVQTEAQSNSAWRKQGKTQEWVKVKLQEMPLFTRDEVRAGAVYARVWGWSSPWLARVGPRPL